MFHIAIECKTAVYFLMFDKCCLQVVDELLTVGLFLEHCLAPRNRDMQRLTSVDGNRTRHIYKDIHYYNKSVFKWSMVP